MPTQTAARGAAVNVGTGSAFTIVELTIPEAAVQLLEFV